MMAAEFDPSASPGPQHELEHSVDYSQLVAAVPAMVAMARNGAENEAISYRSFHVGASAYALKFDGSRAPIVIGGANYKPDKETPKYCAEMDVIDQATEDGFDEIIGMVIAGTTDPRRIRAVTDRYTSTLHPCDVCQEKMRDSKLITSDTIIVTIGLDKNIAQIHAFDDLQTIYELEENDGAFLMSPTIELDLEKWEDKKTAFDYLVQEHADIDSSRMARLVLSNQVQIDS